MIMSIKKHQLVKNEDRKSAFLRKKPDYTATMSEELVIHLKPHLFQSFISYYAINI